MGPVPPGDKTGFYHIVIANLPWSCTWQKLKDFARNHPDGSYLNVDYAHVYPGTTSHSGDSCSGDGWVRVIGREDYRKAFEYLDGAVMESRGLMAFGGNETESIMLKDIKPRRLSTHNQQDTFATWNSSSAPPAYHQSTTTSMNGTHRERGGIENWHQSHQQLKKSVPLPPTISTTSSLWASPPPPYTNPQEVIPVPMNQQYYRMTPTPLLYVGTIASAYPCPAINYAPDLHSFTAPSESSFCSNMSQGIVQPEARKIIITRMSHDIKVPELSNLVRRTSLKYQPHTEIESYHPIESIELLRHSDGKPKGHAFVIYASQGLAEHAVYLLNGKQFQGKSLSVKLAKEGVEPARGYNNVETYRPISQDGPSNERSCRESSGEKAKEVKAREVKSKVAKAKEFKADGSGKEKKNVRSGTSETKDGRKERENSQPLVANGSGSSKRHQ